MEKKDILMLSKRKEIGMNWSEYFMMIVYLVSMKSKDESTHIGAVIVAPDHEIISTGYNSFPRRINDFVKERQERPVKYLYFEHAERNAIYNASRIGIPLKNCIMYTQGIPCADCARAIIQSGIKEIVVHHEWIQNELVSTQELWNDSIKHSEIMLGEAGVMITYFKGRLNNKLNCLFRGCELDDIWISENLEEK